LHIFLTRLQFSEYQDYQFSSHGQNKEEGNEGGAGQNFNHGSDEEESDDKP